MSRAQQAIKGTIWTSGASYLTMLVSFAGNLALARLLLPEDFGTYALAASALTLVFVISGFGSQEAIVQCRDKNIRHLIPTAFWMTIGLGIVLSVIGTFMGLLIMYRQDELVGGLIVILSWVKFMAMIGAAYESTIFRELRYKPMAYQLLFPTLISFIVAVIFAALGLGILSLLIREMVDTGMRLVMAKQASNYKLTMNFDREAANWIWSFGWRTMFSRIGDVIFGKWDNLVVGALMGTTVLGNYAMAYRLAITGSQLTQQPISVISHATYASAQSEKANLQLALEKAVYWLFRSAVLLALLVWFAGAEMTIFLYGAKWKLAGASFRNMFLFVALLPLLTNFKVFLIGSGNINRQLMSQAVQILSFFPLLILATYRENLVAVSWALNLSSVATLLVTVYLVQQIVPVRWRYSFFRPLWVGLLTAILSFAAKRFFGGLVLPDWLFLVLVVAEVGGVYLLLTLVFDGRTLRNELSLIRAHLA
jgi:O-antigen/teichoic acid export membrane protein